MFYRNGIRVEKDEQKALVFNKNLHRLVMLMGYYNWMLWNRIEKDEYKVFIFVKNLQRWMKLMEHISVGGVEKNGRRAFISYKNLQRWIKLWNHKCRILLTEWNHC